ncbi:unnamed protein product [Prunus brigantina]
MLPWQGGLGLTLFMGIVFAFAKNIGILRVRILWKIILSQHLCTLMFIFEGGIECNNICSIKSCMIFAIMMNTLFKREIVVVFWDYFPNKSSQLLYECWRMVHLLIRWMRLPGWGSPLPRRVWLDFVNPRCSMMF